MKKHLESLGADMVISDIELTENIDDLKKRIMDLFQTLPELALNCVGGSNALGLAKLLAYDSIHLFP